MGLNGCILRRALSKKDQKIMNLQVTYQIIKMIKLMGKLREAACKVMLGGENKLYLFLILLSKQITTTSNKMQAQTLNQVIIENF